MTNTGNKVYKKVVVHKFNIFETIDDPELSAAEKLCEWKNTPTGKYIFAHSASQPEYHHYLDPYSYFYKFVITAELEEKYITEYYLRWGDFLKG